VIGKIFNDTIPHEASRSLSATAELLVYQEPTPLVMCIVILRANF